MTRIQSESGFSVVELLVATGLMLIVSGVMTSAIVQMTKSQLTIFNRTEMYSGVRGATELLQQEVGQAGRISLPARITLQQAVQPIGGAAPAASAVCNSDAPGTGAATVRLTSDSPGLNAVTGMFASAAGTPAHELLTILDGDSQESITIASLDAAASTLTACFKNPHAAGAVLVPLGAFATGIIPSVASGMVNGSSATVLKMYGDINGDGRMVYVEYTCDAAGSHNFYRNVMPFDTLPGNKPALTASHILLANVVPNPDGTDCFRYQSASVTVDGTPFTFVLDVALTLTVETAQVDPITKTKQSETKALLNVSPRNIVNAWMSASIGYTDRMQSMPASVAALLP